MATPTTQVNMRLTEAERQKFDRAAASAGISRTQLFLEATHRRADELLAEDNRMELDPESFDALQAMLDAPPVIPDGLRRLLSRRPIWESEG